MDMTTVGGFDWDEGNRATCQKHDVTITAVEAAFLHPHHLAPDVAHSAAETRFLAIGKGAGLRLIFVAFTRRDNDEGARIRPISALYAPEGN